MRTAIEFNTTEPKLVMVDTEDKRVMKHIEDKFGEKNTVKEGLGVGSYFVSKDRVIELIQYLIKLR